MWVRQESSEIERDKRIRTLFRILMPLIVGATLMGSVVILQITGISWHSARGPKTWQEIMETLPLIVYIVLGSSVAVAWFFRPRFTFICSVCGSTKKDDGHYSCECGGVFRDGVEFKWIEPDKRT